MSRDSPFRGDQFTFGRSIARNRGETDGYAEEFLRMLAQRDQEYNANLDVQMEGFQSGLEQSLENAIQRHEAVRLEAAAALEQYKMQVEQAERDRVHRAQLEHQQAQHLEQAELLRKQQEAEYLVHEAERQRLEQEEKLRKMKEATEALKRQRAEEAARRQKEEAQEAQKAREAEQARKQVEAAKAVAAPVQTPTSLVKSSAPESHVAQHSITAQPVVNVAVTPGVTIAIQQKDVEHQKYLDLHKRLKRLRRQVKSAGPPVKEWKDKRATITKSLGQLTNEMSDSLSPKEKAETRQKNLERRKAVMDVLKAAQNAPGPTVDAREYIVNPNSQSRSLDPAAAQVPAVLIYLISITAKVAIKTIKGSAYPLVEILGQIIAFIFGARDLRFQGNSFVDILLAKYHFVCPILFGIYGSEDTSRGCLRLGLAYEKEGELLVLGKNQFFEDQRSLAVGWAALTLRDFRKAKTSDNVCPPYNYWKSIACIVNTPAEEVTRVHLIVLKHLLENHAGKFIKFYGQAATVALRSAVVEFPAKLGNREWTEKNGLEFLRDGIKREHGITI